MRIAAIDLFGTVLTYAHGNSVMYGGRAAQADRVRTVAEAAGPGAFIIIDIILPPPYPAGHRVADVC